MIALRPVLLAVLQLAPWLGEARATQIAKPIARAVYSEDDGRLLAVIEAGETNFVEEYRTCDRLGDRGQAFGSFQLHAYHFGPYSAQQVCKDQTLQAHLAQKVLGTTGTIAQRIARYMGRSLSDKEVQRRTNAFETLNRQEYSME